MALFYPHYNYQHFRCLDKRRTGLQGCPPGFVLQCIGFGRQISVFVPRFLFTAASGEKVGGAMGQKWSNGKN